MRSGVVVGGGVGCRATNPSQQLRAAAPGLQLAWLFHDAIPWQQALCRLPESAAAQAHARYMRSIAGDAVIFCNSRSSRIDLLCFLAECGHQPLSDVFPRVHVLCLWQKPFPQSGYLLQSPTLGR